MLNEKGAATLSDDLMSPLKASINKVLSNRKKLVNFYHQNESVINEYHALLSAQHVAEEAMKRQVRPASVQGESVTVFNNNQLHVSVLVRMKSPTFDVSAVRSSWPETLADQVISEIVNSDLAQAALKAGLVSSEAYKGAMNPLVPTGAPAVTIRYSTDVPK
jgi:hypothetical protein